MNTAQPGWVVSKRAVVSEGGVVAAQHPLAAEAGIAMLARGGNAVDAAIAAALAVGVVEPWLSGIGGGGFMLVRGARDGGVHGIDFGMTAPGRLDPGRYRIVGGDDQDWFQWPRVEGDRNIKGHDAICVPGAVAGLGLAAERFAVLPWDELVAPAIALAEAGMEVDWYASLSIAVDASGLDEFPASRAVFLPGGRPPVTRERGAEQRLANPALAATLKRLAEAGPRDFYAGRIAGQIAADLAAGGSPLDADDLARYRPRVMAPATLDYRGTRLHAMPGLTGGPTYLAALAALAEMEFHGAEPGPQAFAGYARAIGAAYATRLASFGHAGTTNEPASEPANEPGCTSHVSVIDAKGNMVALTNSLLSRFGAKVVLPSTGMLMNNGMMWFDPRPGRPNAIAAGQRPLANMCPVLATRGGAPALAMGAAGGRQIVPALVQLTSFLLDFGMALEAAFHLPRLDASTRTVLCNARMPAAQVAALARHFPVACVEDTVYPVQFAVPNAVQHDAASGRNTGMVHVTTPWPTALAERAA